MILNSCAVLAAEQRGFEHGQRVAASRDIAFEIEAAGASDGAFAEAGDQRALPRLPLGAMLGEPAFNFVTGNAPKRKIIERERIVGSSSPAFSVSRKMVANSGGSSRTLSSELAASFMKAESVKM